MYELGCVNDHPTWWPGPRVSRAIQSQIDCHGGSQMDQIHQLRVVVIAVLGPSRATVSQVSQLHVGHRRCAETDHEIMTKSPCKRSMDFSPFNNM